MANAAERLGQFVFDSQKNDVCFPKRNNRSQMEKLLKIAKENDVRVIPQPYQKGLYLFETKRGKTFHGYIFIGYYNDAFEKLCRELKLL